jgi:hypothetical protein
LKFRCEDLDQALREQEPALLTAAGEHAMDCVSCREELKWWREISTAAKGLHTEWESAGLWGRIQAGRRRKWVFLAAAAAVLIAVALVWPSRKASPDFLTERALAEAQSAEAAYIASIDRLAKLAEPRLAQAESPLLASYRERLQLLDEAIAELKTQAEGNPFYAQVRGELAALYKEKQKTLEEVLKYANPKR